VLWIVGHQVVDSLARLIGRRAQVTGVKGEARDARDAVDERRRSLGVGHRRHVVRDARPERDDVHVDLGETQFEGRTDTRGDFEFARHRAHERQQVRARLGRGANHADRSSVGGRSWKGSESHDQAHVEASRGVGHDVDEVAPVKVGFGSDEKKDVRAVAVVTVAQLDLGPRELGRNAVDDARKGSARTLVDEVLGVKGGEDLGIDGAKHRRDGRTRTQPGVDPTFEAYHQHGLVEFGVREEDDAVVDFVVHYFSSVWRAKSASQTICFGNSTTLPWSPALAPALYRAKTP